MGVWRRAKVRTATAEYFSPSCQLYMNFNSDGCDEICDLRFMIFDFSSSLAVKIIVRRFSQMRSDKLK